MWGCFLVIRVTVVPKVLPREKSTLGWPCRAWWCPSLSEGLLPAGERGGEAASPIAARVLCRLALSSLNKLSEAVFYYRKALELDPENETYKSNLKVTEQKMREAPSPVSVWLAG